MITSKPQNIIPSLRDRWTLWAEILVKGKEEDRWLPFGSKRHTKHCLDRDLIEKAYML